jgi:hypothetical protein
VTLEKADLIRRAHWVEGYRLAHRAADRWAESPSGIRHSIETQVRIFQMAEELRQRRDYPNARILFPVLKAVDDAATWDTGPGGAPTPMSAAAAGLVGYKVLFGKLPPVRGHDWPEGFELTDEGEAELATFGLRFHGFDPIVFDGTDPAAFVWALFQVAQREAACDAEVRCYGHRACPPRGLAVIPTPIQPRTLATISLGHSAQPAGVGR